MTNPTQRIELRAATSADHNCLAPMLLAYQAEIAVFSDGVDMDRTLEPVWFEHPGLFPFVIERDSVPVGMALVMGRKHAAAEGEDVDYYFNDLWVDPSVRGTGVAERGVRLVLERLPGSWAILVLEKNARARGFWERVLADVLPAGGSVADGDGNPVHRFST